MKLKKENLATAIYENYIAGRDDDGEDYFKLENENPKPFFQKNIQHIKRESAKPNSKEEKTLLDAYNELYKFTEKENIKKHYNINIKLDDLKYETLLKIIRDQVVKYLKVIFITVTEEEEAYTIFETLNARGMNLSFVDLIKNTIFKELKGTHPDDDAKTTWKNIRQEISSRENVGTLEAFVRHWWASKYPYASEKKFIIILSSVGIREKLKLALLLNNYMMILKFMFKSALPSIKILNNKKKDVCIIAC